MFSVGSYLEECLEILGTPKWKSQLYTLSIIPIERDVHPLSDKGVVKNPDSKS